MLAVKHPPREPPTLPTTLSTPDGSYVLKFDNPQNGGRWKPNYFTKLLIPADLRNKMFVSRQPPVEYGAVLVGIYRLRIPARCCLLGSECSRLSQPSSTSQDRHSPVSQSQRPSRFMIPPNKAQRVLRAKSVRWPPICAPLRLLPASGLLGHSGNASSSKVYGKRGLLPGPTLRSQKKSPLCSFTVRWPFPTCGCR